MDIQVKVIAKVIQERKNQDRQWGGASHDDTHSLGEWIQYINHQMNDATFQACFPVPDYEIFKERLIKTAALCVATLEALERSGK